MLMLNSVIRILLDPFRSGHETDPGSKKSAWIMENFHKKSTKITRISYIFFFKNIKLLFYVYNFNFKSLFCLNNYPNYRSPVTGNTIIMFTIITLAWIKLDIFLGFFIFFLFKLKNVPWSYAPFCIFREKKIRVRRK